MRLSAVFAASAIAVLAAGCDELAKAGNENVLVFTLMQTPDFDLPDGSSAPGITTASAFYGRRDPSKLDSPPEGIPGATVTLKWGTKSCRLTDKTQGTYLADSASDPTCGSMRPLEEVEYTLEVINDQNETFTGKVTPPPATVIAEFESTDAVCTIVESGTDSITLPKCREHTRNTAFTITRKNKATGAVATGPQTDLGFWAVYKLSGNIDVRHPNATNAPQQAIEFLQLIAADAPFKTASFTIPASAFDATSDTMYGVGLMVSKKGTTSGNLFLGSVVIGGHGAGGLLRVKP